MGKTVVLRVTVDFNAQQVFNSLGVEEQGKVQTAFDNAIYRGCIPYCPFDTGVLAQTVEGIGTGMLEYVQPYARYLYYGEVYGPNIPVFDDDSGVPTRYFSPPVKYPTGRQLTYRTDINPLAGSFWFERAKADHKEDWIREAVAVIA